MSQQQSANRVSIDDVPINIANTQSDDVDPGEVLEEIKLIIRELAGEQLPTNPLIAHLI